VLQQWDGDAPGRAPRLPRLAEREGLGQSQECLRRICQRLRREVDAVGDGRQVAGADGGCQLAGAQAGGLQPVRVRGGERLVQELLADRRDGLQDPRRELLAAAARVEDGQPGLKRMRGRVVLDRARERLPQAGGVRRVDEPFGSVRDRDAHLPGAPARSDGSETVTAATLRRWPLPEPGSDKEARGRTLVVGGSARTPGAVLLAAEAALRSGAGKLQVATARSVAAPVGKHPDGLHHLDGRAVLTPNLTELALTLGTDPEDIGDDAADATARLAARARAVVSCGGAESWIAAPDGRAWLDQTGGVGLGVSGSGDVRAGIVTGLAARGADAAQAAVWGTYVHGRAGDRLAAQVGRLGFLARELLAEVPRVLAEIEV
jgi:NAD(P)H-hydrate repair Nnr-like enzyme with NAD(P)H-hydrate dehydratase domain